ncbi:3-beta-hydroxysteroid-Delta(8),Delta(7)-isomerase [Sodiomyces alkalinus F11]|uniref:3-beta-hydroxysteroid-Delta(8), Delta(7)-isomerase n=1 Tax=Sodiomyces alkalinus (strain CBS 110278 / VKM F-3762 / F11) TaxID=1314773 RepID=A0A3N2Q115_SODAK|nr:3-beta-hydroxysteroid-Delta(8),Delta(7)-isomerase [Sodiomyces alkalinus F11]ROT40454.1 3-beta-hydroxysteroid-Delta(8),Delta(7)-isomerase [Sodiomyces alkalinus F11]
MSHPSEVPPAHGFADQASAIPSHPYYPLGVDLPDYVPNTLDTLSILAIFSTTLAAVLLPVLIFIRRYNPKLSASEIAIALWFVLCGVIHLGLEGYFVLNHTSITSQHATLAQLWKEYSLSDSRYLTSDPFMVCMEAITAWAWGPLSFFCAFAVVTQCPLRHPAQALVSTGQLYGCVLYFAIAQFAEATQGIAYSRPEARFFYGYYVAFNAPWIIIPTALLLQSFGACTAAFKALDAQKGSQNAK